MKLDTISILEQHITDVLLSSPLIPLGVNVVRLAATTDEEGIAALSRSIVVRYTGSSISLQKIVPQHVERTLSFEVIHSAQSYLSESGHDAACQMCQAAYLGLNNTIPVRSGTTILVPFSMTSETFQGLTDSSHYVYVQNWELKIHEISPQLTLNPCVLAGNCSEVFPNDGGEFLPGDVLFNNDLYAPVLPPPTGEDYEEELCGVEVAGENLVYKHDPDQIFLEEYKQHMLVSTGTFDESGKFLICNIHDVATGDFIMMYYASNCDDRSLFGITANYHLGQNPSMLNNLVLKGQNSLGWINVWPNTKVYHDPTEADGPTTIVRYGWVVRVETGIKLEVDGEEFVKANAAPFTYGWVKLSEVTLYSPERYESIVNCIDLEAENDGPQACVQKLWTFQNIQMDYRRNTRDCLRLK